MVDRELAVTVLAQLVCARTDMFVCASHAYMCFSDEQHNIGDDVDEEKHAYLDPGNWSQFSARDRVAFRHEDKHEYEDYVAGNLPTSCYKTTRSGIMHKL